MQPLLAPRDTAHRTIWLRHRAILAVYARHREILAQWRWVAQNIARTRRHQWKCHLALQVLAPRYALTAIRRLLRRTWLRWYGSFLHWANSL
jgi:hypothetical protein